MCMNTFVFLFLTSLCKTSSRFIHLTTTEKFISFYGWVIFHYIYTYIYIYIYTHHIFITHLSVDGHLGCFHVLAILDSVALGSMCLLELWFFSGYMPTNRTAGSFLPSLLRNPHTILHSGCTNRSALYFSVTILLKFGRRKLLKHG